MGAKADRKKIGWPGKTVGGIIAGLLLGAPGTEAWAEPAEDSISVSHDVNFDVNNMWDDDDDVWNLNLATDEVPEEGISFAMDVLIPVSEGEEPSFEGRIRVQTALLLGESEEWAQSNAVTELVSDDFSKIVTVGGNTYGSATIVVPFSETVGTNANGQWVNAAPFDQAVTQPVRNVVIFFVGRRCDYLSLTGEEFSAVLYNSGSALRNGLPEIDISSCFNIRQNICGIRTRFTT